MSSPKPVAQRLQTHLDAAHHRAQRKERILLALGAGAIVLALWAILAPLSLAISVGLAAWILRTGLLVALAGAVVLLKYKWPRRIFASTRIAEVVALQSEGRRSAVQTASELIAWKNAGGMRAQRRPPPSLSLVEAHLEETEAALDASKANERVDRAFKDLERRANYTFAIAGLLLIVSAAIFPAQHRALVRAFASTSEAEISDLPLVGDLQLTLRYPAYTGLHAREVKGGDGTIRGLKGTTVQLRATAEKPPRSASLTIGEGNAARVVPLAVDGRDLIGEFMIDKNDRYRFSVKPLFGSELKERKGHAIVVDEDKYPTIEIREPAQDLELKDTGRLSIAYASDDDFAISEIALNYRVNSGNVQRVVLPAPEQKQRIRSDYAFDLSTLQLKPGDIVTIELEAKDNDTVSGPKKTTSRQRKITAFSSDQHRRQLLARFRAVVDKLVDQLGDELENPLSESADSTAYTQKALPVDERGLSVAMELSDIAKGLKDAEGGQSKFALAAERSAIEMRQAYSAKKLLDTALSKSRTPQNLATTAQRQNETVLLLEKTVIYFEDLRALAAIEEMKAQAKELQATSQQLKELLQKYKETGDEALKTALEAEINELKRRIGEIMQKMAELRKGLPQEFVNREAVERRAMENIFDKVDQLLAENRLDELAGELDRLDNQIKNMENAMNDAEQEYGGERYSELKRELQEMAQNLEAVEAAQKDVMEKTRDAEQAYREAAQKQLGQNLDQMVKQSLKDLEDAERALQKANEKEPRVSGGLDKAQSRVGDTRNALEQRDFLEAREMARNAQAEARDVTESLKSLARIDQLTSNSSGKRADDAHKAAQEAYGKIAEVAKRLEKLFPDPKDVLSPKQMQALDELRKRQQEIAQRTGKISQQMKDINKQAPMFDQNAQSDMEGAKGSMERAGQELGQKQAGRAVSSQAAALGQLQKMKDAMKRQGQGQGGAMPMPIGGMPNPFGDGNDARNQEKVEIPSGEQFKVPPEFRRDILDAMKQGTPQKFKQQVDEFYKELIK
ncbi:MAG: DUF4175 family protein [Deltaproteobacteria bacterium]|nr:DUF4175 family protein [Deltaproteobacteria bacterium]